MEHPYQHLIHISAQDDVSFRQADAALLSIINYPEIVERIIIGNQIKGDQIKVIAGEKVAYSGYNPATHHIHYNPHITSATQLLDSNNKLFQETTKRSFAHNIAHSTQAAFTDIATQYESFVIHTSNQLTAPFYNDILHNENKIRAVMKDTDSLVEILHAIYDQHIGNNMDAILDSFQCQLEGSSIVQTFNDEFEIPAIEFENMIAQKYLQEPIRTTGCIDYMIYQLKSGLQREYLMQKLLSSLNIQHPNASSMQS